MALITPGIAITWPPDRCGRKRSPCQAPARSAETEACRRERTPTVCCSRPVVARLSMAWDIEGRGTRLYSYTTGGYLYAAPSVSNGQVYTGGTDDNVYAFGLATPTTPPPDPNCPSSWTCQDIGNPTPSGSETASGNTWSVNAGGAGVGGASDQFRLISQTVSGDSQVSAQVVSQQLASGSAQAGLMVRQS